MLTQTSEYALRAMCALAARPGETVPAADLATQAGVPPPYLAKIMQQLAGANFVTGRRGIGGGYTLSIDPTRVTALEIMMALGPVRKPRSASEIDGLADGFGALHRCLDEAAQCALDRFRRTSIEQLAQDLSAVKAKREHTLSVKPMSNGHHRTAG